MKKTRGSALFLIVVLMIAIISACSKSNKDSGDSNAESQQVTPEPSQTSSQAASTDQSKSELEGTIRISLQGKSSSVWNAVADAYMKEHPKVKVVVDNKPAEGYKDWLTAQFAAGTPDVDMVMSNEVENLKKDKKFVDYFPWFEKDNPYTGKKWKESLDLDAMGVNFSEDHLWDLNFESVQIVWMYNKEIFAEVGIKETPKTFNELIGDFKKIKEKGYTPFALAGNSTSMWSGPAGWLVRIYADQYLRDSVEIVRAQPEDYVYHPEVDDKWKYDLQDPYNDSNTKVTKNNLRLWKAVQEKTGPFQVEGNPKWRAYMENLKALFQYTPEGFFGVNDDQAYSLFLTGKAATMVSVPASYWQLPKDFADEKKTGAKGGVKPFEYGFFNMPTMEGPEVMAPARTIHLPIGFYSFVAKDAKQTELDMDFIMYLTSPKGYHAYLEGIQNSTDEALSGSPALKDIELPAEMAKAFANFEPIGNTEGFISAANNLARGMWDYQPSVQDWVGLIQKYFDGQLTVDQYLSGLQANLDKYFVPSLKEHKLDPEDLKHPERKPPERN